MADIVLITGMSGAGRSGAANVLEDLGWYVIDNLPTSLVTNIVDLASKPAGGIDRLALVAGRATDELLDTVTSLRKDGHHVRLLFLDASTPELVRRYDHTRRRHPLHADADGLVESIELERARLLAVRDAADLVVDTSDLTIHQLKDRITDAFDQGAGPTMQLSVESFGFKHGLPLDADIVMDVRFLPNPHWVEELRPLTGHDQAIKDYVLQRPDTAAFLEQFDSLLRTIVPSYQAEGRSYLTIAVGCTGGHHRSVAIVEELAARLRSRDLVVRVGHRDINR